MSLESVYSENAVNIYKKLYLARNNNNEIIETIDECHDRVANFLAKSGDEYNNFRRLLDEQKFRPNTPCMANAGIKENPMMLACFVVSLQDSMDSIIDMWGTCAKIYEGGGGAGIPITNLRCKNSPLSSGGLASGPLSYLDVVESIANTVKSGGRNRRAANLIAAKHRHPDIVDIINCKRDKKSYKSMNLSVTVDDEFMEAVFNLNDDDSTVVELYDPKKGYGKTISVQGLWNHIIRASWETGDPGLLFLDRINEDNPMIESMGKIECSNPCGEVVLWPDSCCCLGHMNLNKYIDKQQEFKDDIFWAVLFLNRILEKTSYPNEKFKKTMLKTRPIGLGFMGFADILYKLKIRYGSQASIDLIQEITKILTASSFEASAKLALQGKIPSLDFSNDQEKTNFMNFVHKFSDASNIPGNMTVTCIAPTGSTSISADCSYSFEPHFALTWIKNLDGGEQMIFLDSEFEKTLNNVLRCGKYARDKDEVIREIKRNKGTLKNTYFPEEYQWIRDVFVTAHDIPNEQRLEVQAAAQNYITMSVSSTVNLPNSATKEDVANVYLKAWKKGLKGITVFRDGSLDDQPINFGTETELQQTHIEAEKSISDKSKSNAASDTSIFGKEYKRPMERNGKVVEVNTPAGKLYVRGSFDNGRLMEVFLDVGQQGSRENVLFNGLGRVISRSLQRGVDLFDITDTLRGSGGDHFWIKLNPDEERSYPVEGILDAVATILDEKFSGQHIEGVIQELESEINETIAGYSRCPECQRYSLRMDAGCRGGICTVCGYSNCQ